MSYHQFVAILTLMIVIGKAKSDGSSNSGSNNVDDDRCSHLSEPNSTWITNAAQTFLFWAVQSKSQKIPVCQASLLYSALNWQKEACYTFTKSWVMVNFIIGSMLPQIKIETFINYAR